LLIYKFCETRVLVHSNLWVYSRTLYWNKTNCRSDNF